MWHGVLAASSMPCRTVISVPTTTLACNRWLRCGRVWKSHNTSITRLSSKDSLAALQLSSIECCGRDRMWHGILAASSVPCRRIIGVELAIVGVACATCLPTEVSGTTRRLIGVAGGVTVRRLNAARCGPRLRVVSRSIKKEV